MTDRSVDAASLSEQSHFRQEKLAALRQGGFSYPNHFKPTHSCQDALTVFNDHPDTPLLLAGRMMSKRVMGKAAFFNLQDSSGLLQIYIKSQELLSRSENSFEDFLDYDLGDILGVEGLLFYTKTGELSLKAQRLVLLSKSLHPLPDKFHGLSDIEQCYRHRHLDLIANAPSRQRFLMRTKIISFIRDFLKKRDFLEVETPMMHPIPGGATARPFITHHNTYHRDLYLRVAPELYLKRLVVGGFDRVFEINRNFRNEGISPRHNPEFTMLEFYAAYWTYTDLMDLTEGFFRELCEHCLERSTCVYQGLELDFAQPFQRFTLSQSLLHYHPRLSPEMLSDYAGLKRFIEQELSLTKIPAPHPEDPLGALQCFLFEETVETQLQQPTFITAYPSVVSPLARPNDTNPLVTDRFELFIAGREIANGYSESNDPHYQAMRFAQQAQAAQAGDAESMHYDADYIQALEYGLAPTGGQGIGIDRLVMLLTNAPSIRDVILFPQLR